MEFIAIKNNHTFVWDEEKASDNNKEYIELIRNGGGGTWEIIDCTKESKPNISVGIAAMSVAKDLKYQNNRSQNLDWGIPEGGIASITTSAVLEKQKNKRDLLNKMSKN